MLRVTELTKTFTDHLRPDPHPRTVLDGASLTVPAGTCIAVTGASGSGKSSLLRCIYGTYAADSGHALIDVTPCSSPGTESPGDRRVVDVVEADPRAVVALRRDHMGMITQFLSVPPRVAAVDLVADAATAHSPMPHQPEPHPEQAETGPDRNEPAHELLSRLGLARELHQHPPATFSGGERQLVNIAIALARPRALLLVDEATASLDPHRRGAVLDALAGRKRAGAAVLAIFHDVPDTPDLVDQVCHLRGGRIEELR